MNNLPQITVRSADPVPTAEYDAKVTSIEAVDGNYGEQIKFTFELQHPDYGGRKLSLYARSSESAKSKLVQVVNAIQGRPLQQGETINWDALLNRPCRLVVVKATKPDGTVYNKVESVLPARPSTNGNDPFTQ